MFRNTFQSGFLSILYAIGSKPLQIWRKNINNGYVKRITDFEMQSSVIEICGANVSTCFLSCPSKPKQTLGIKMPFLVLLIKYLKKYFTFEVQVIDDKNVKRRFRASNYQSNTRVKPFICTIPMLSYYTLWQNGTTRVSNNQSLALVIPCTLSSAYRRNPLYLYRHKNVVTPSKKVSVRNR